MHDSRYPQTTARQVSRPSGFTLIELMVTIAVMAVLLMIAAPSFTDTVLGMRLNSHATDLVASTYTARSEAIKRNAVITLCASADGSTCAAAGGWEQGWIVTDGTSVIHRQSSASPGFLVTGVAPGTSTVIRSLSFQPTGIGVTPITLTVCRAMPSPGKAERVINITATGRASTTKTSTGTCV